MVLGKLVIINILYCKLVFLSARHLSAQHLVEGGIQYPHAWSSEPVPPGGERTWRNGESQGQGLPRGPAGLRTPRVESGPGFQERPPHTFQCLPWCWVLWCSHFWLALLPVTPAPLASPQVCFESSLQNPCSRGWEGRGPPHLHSAVRAYITLTGFSSAELFVHLLTHLLLPHLRQCFKHLFLCVVLNVSLHPSCLHGLVVGMGLVCRQGQQDL